MSLDNLEFSSLFSRNIYASAYRISFFWVLSIEGEEFVEIVYKASFSSRKCDIAVMISPDTYQINTQWKEPER